MREMERSLISKGSDIKSTMEHYGLLVNVSTNPEAIILLLMLGASMVAGGLRHVTETFRLNRLKSNNNLEDSADLQQT